MINKEQEDKRSVANTPNSKEEDGSIKSNSTPVQEGLRESWPDEVRLKMIDMSEFYPDNERVYQYGFYDGYQYLREKLLESDLDKEEIK